MKKILLLVIICSSLVASAQKSITWMSSQNIASNTYGNMHPRIVTNAAGNPVIIWGRMSDQSVFISQWNGSAFTTPVKINPAWLTVATASWMGPDIAAKGDTMYVVMKRTPEASDTNHIYISRSTNSGMTFSVPTRVEFIADSISRFPCVTIDDSGNPVVGFMKFNSAFMESRWAVTRSTDFGNTFSTDVKASGWSASGALVCDCCPGALVKAGNTIAMLYRDNDNNTRDMWAGLSVNGGSFFAQGMPVDQKNWMISACPASGPDGTVIGDTLYSTYYSEASGMSLVYLSRSSLSSMTGSVGTELTGMFTGLAFQNYPRIAGAGNALAVVWTQQVNGADQLALRFTADISASLSSAYDTVDLGNVTNADVTLINGTIFVVWEDDNTGTVRYRKGTFAPVITDIENVSQNLFSVSPNPASDMLNIKMTTTGKSKISITDILGQQLFKTEIADMQNSISINTSQWDNGIYFVSLESGNMMSTQKVIINK